MKITITTENCDRDNEYLIEESADSVIHIKMEFSLIVTSQSRKVLIDQLKLAIQSELSKFKWIIVGSLLVDIVWYLNALERQETDKVGDIDNITKPIQDALCGPNGIMIDDSQIGGLYSYWMSRNDLLVDNVVIITIKFNNDFVVQKDRLFFVQYSGPICLPFNTDFSNTLELAWLKVAVKHKQKMRILANMASSEGLRGHEILVLSQYDFHRTRINGFKSISLKEFDKKCKDAGLTFKILMDLSRRIRSSDSAS